ncbi:hypothetical protein OSB04_001419 [Centaurea solstitialis]|uniref:Sulfotransferase n=1 Tax=Centaurea solstitialis TaxID=347529 RepID=A0AA38TQY4_9ASTR|nr:hypothetical protein OSB04_001419 [Centaurea solstitialis]
MEDAPFEEAFDDFCLGNSNYGPYWDHILGYWKASLERPGRILFLKYEDMKRDPKNDVKKLAEFIGYPFSIEEEEAGVVEKTIQLCSFENLSKLEVNKRGKLPGKYRAIENRYFYRKAKVGDWENYFTDEMKEKIDKLTDQKMSGTGNFKSISSISAMEDIFETLVQHNPNWSKGRLTFYKYQGFWNTKDLVEGTTFAQQSFKVEPSDVLLSSCPKTGTTWLKALAFAIATRDKFDDSTSPLLTTLSHECIPLVEKYVEHIEDNHKNAGSPGLVATHLPYASLPKSFIASNCKIVYIYGNVKDVVVSYYHYIREVLKLSMEDAPFEEAFNDFCQGISPYDHTGIICWDIGKQAWKGQREFFS